MNIKEYIQKYYMIRTKKGELIPFEFNHAQNQFYDIIKENFGKKPGRFIVLKARQLGISTETSGIFSYLTMNSFYTDTVVVAHERDSANKIFAMYKLMYEKLPEPLKPETRYSNARELTFDNEQGTGLKSSIRVSVAGEGARSSTYRYAHVSELAFWQHPETAMLALLQTVPFEDDTIVIIESTANGYNYFYQMWEKAVNGESDFIPIFFAWYLEPTYKAEYNGFKLTEYEESIKERFNLTNEQLAWRRWCIANNCNGDEEKFRQEYPITPEEAFITSGSPVFDVQIVLDRMKVVKEPMKKGYFKYDYDGLHITNIEWIDDDRGYISIYEEPTGDFTVLSGDTAGDGEDYFVGHVLSREGRQMAVLHHQFDEDLYTKQMYCLGMHYRSLIGIEINYSTYPTMELQRLEYPRLYVRKSYDQALEMYQEKYGFNTTKLTRPIIISQLVEIVREHTELIVDKSTLNEMLSFVKVNGRPEASEGMHDDLVMGLAIGYEILKQIPPVETVEVEKEEYDEETDFFSYGM